MTSFSFDYDKKGKLLNLPYRWMRNFQYGSYLAMSYPIYLPTYISRGAHLVQTLLNLAPSQSSPPAVMQYEYLYLFTLGSFNNALECARALFL